MKQSEVKLLIEWLNWQFSLCAHIVCYCMLSEYNPQISYVYWGEWIYRRFLSILAFWCYYSNVNFLQEKPNFIFNIRHQFNFKVKKCVRTSFLGVFFVFACSNQTCNSHVHIRVLVTYWVFFVSFSSDVEYCNAGMHKISRYRFFVFLL